MFHKENLSKGDSVSSGPETGLNRVPDNKTFYCTTRPFRGVSGTHTGISNPWGELRSEKALSPTKNEIDASITAKKSHLERNLNQFPYWHFSFN